jgi:hypothetical protein
MDLEGGGRGLIMVLSWPFPGRTAEKRKEPHLLNTRLERYRYANLLNVAHETYASLSRNTGRQP